MPKTQGAPLPDAQFSLKLSPRGVARLHGGHVWVYRSDVAVSDDVPKGALVSVIDPRGKFLGTALYSSSSLQTRFADLSATGPRPSTLWSEFGIFRVE
jgi:23S rRNA G2069 N7-methylase RlmK/C1962 C5-methylase RlmI